MTAGIPSVTQSDRFDALASEFGIYKVETAARFSQDSLQIWVPIHTVLYLTYVCI